MTAVSPRPLAPLLFALAVLLPACAGSPAQVEPTAAAPSPTAAQATEPTPTSTPVPTPVPPPTPLQSPAPIPEEREPVEALPLAPVELEPAFPGIEFDRMVLLTHAGDDTGRLFLVLQPGMIVVFENDPGVESAQTFLDIRERVSDAGNEEGLLGLAFDPAYAEDGYFYVYYSASRPRRSVVSRFSVSLGDPNRAEPGSELVFLEVEQPYSNHNGGHIVFGPDGMLYVGLGDGGAAGDPQGNGQDTSTLLGSILRIDVSRLDSLGTYAVPDDNPFAGSGGTARGEIWAYGLRNPWRFSFDLEAGTLWAADVGQNLYEEVDIIRPGLNYGWNVMEGSHCFRQTRCDAGGFTMPVAEYGRERRMLRDRWARLQGAAHPVPLWRVPVRRLLQRKDMGAQARRGSRDGADGDCGYRAVHLVVRRGLVRGGLRPDVRRGNIPFRGPITIRSLPSVHHASSSDDGPEAGRVP